MEQKHNKLYSCFKTSDCDVEIVQKICSAIKTFTKRGYLDPLILVTRLTWSTQETRQAYEKRVQRLCKKHFAKREYLHAWEDKSEENKDAIAKFMTQFIYLLCDISGDELRDCDIETGVNQFIYKDWKWKK